MKLLKIAITVAAVLLGQATYGAETIKIGFNTPLTGFAAADGKSALTGAELALEQINAAGGVNGMPLELVVYDDQASPKESVPIANKLIEQDKVAIGISGSYSGATRAAAGSISGCRGSLYRCLRGTSGYHTFGRFRFPHLVRRRSTGPRRGQADW